MSDAITAIFCTLCMAAGWFYLARSEGVQRLSMMESPRRNATRRKARRLGAWSMIMIGASGFWLMFEIGRTDWHNASQVQKLRLLVASIAVGVALLTMMLSAVIDVYLTMRMRQSFRGRK